LTDLQRSQSSLFELISNGFSLALHFFLTEILSFQISQSLLLRFHSSSFLIGTKQISLSFHPFLFSNRLFVLIGHLLS
jgi:hypothetical protein